MNRWFRMRRAYEGLNEIIDFGLELFNGNVNERSLKRWYDYSGSAVDHCSRDVHRSIYLDYLRLIAALENRNDLSAKARVGGCLDYLAEMSQWLRGQIG